jgi:hypothetical protein
MNPRPPSHGLRSAAILIGCGVNIIGALIILFGTGPQSARALGPWAFVQCISGVWAGVFGANSPFFNGMVAGLPAVALGLLSGPRLPWPFVIMAWFLVPASALLAAAIMRFMRRRGP